MVTTMILSMAVRVPVCQCYPDCPGRLVVTPCGEWICSLNFKAWSKI